jgi:hypothetical protein
VELRSNPALKVYSRLWVGAKPQHEGDVPLAFATPFTDDAACLKRRATVAGWLRAHGPSCPPLPREQVEAAQRVVENSPTAGFRVTSDVRRVYWGGGNVVWRVHDPRGWELEISSANLFALVQTVGLGVGGLIPGSCVWARDGAANVLLPVTSPEYAAALQGAEGLRPLKAAGRVAGATYALTDGREVVYAGRLWLSGWRTGGFATRACRAETQPGMYATFYAQETTYEVVHATPYEVVLVETAGERVAVAYKKAPLLRRLGEGVDAALAADPVAALAGLPLTPAGAKTFDFAGAFAADPGPLVVGRRPVTDAELAGALARLEATPAFGKATFHGNEGDGSLSGALGGYPHLIDSGAIVGVCAEPGGALHTLGCPSQMRGVDVLLPLVERPGSVTRLSVSWNDHPRSATVLGQVTATAARHIAPSAVPAALRALHAAGRLFVVIPVPKEPAA